MTPTQFPLTEKTRNLVRFCRHQGFESLDAAFLANYAFRDAGSRFSILKNVQTLPGPDECYATHHADARLFFAKLLGLEVDFPNQPAADNRSRQLYNSMNYYRSHIEELFTFTAPHRRPLPPFAGACTMAFAEADHLVIHYRLRNPSAAEVPLRLRWVAEPAAGLDSPAAVTMPGGFRFSCVQKIKREYAPHVSLAGDAADLTFAWADGRFVSAWVERTLPPNGAMEFTFRADFAFDRPPALVRTPQKADAVLAAARRAAEDRYAALGTLPRPFQRHEPLVLKAAGTLHTLRYRDTDPAGRPVMTIHAGKCGVTATWFWDGAFTLLGLGLLRDAKTAQGMTRLLLGGISPSGDPCCTYQAGEYAMHDQQPILAWGLGHYLAQCPDPILAAESYGPLCRYVRRWLLTCDRNGNGLVEYPSGCCWDDALRWQTRFPITPRPGEDWAAADWGRMAIGEFESVDTNTHLYLECRTLARLAAVSGHTAEAVEWDGYAERLADRINDLLFNEAAGVYQDRSVVDGRFTGMVTAAGFLPLYAGIVPRNRARQLARTFLLDPHHFYTLLPFPCLDASHPAFRPGGFVYASPDHPGSLNQQAYWIGRSWPHVSFWLVGALWQAGLKREADAAADRILDAMGRSEAIFECYDPLTGYGNGHPEFMWSSAAVLALAYRRYREDPVGEIGTASRRS